MAKRIRNEEVNPSNRQLFPVPIDIVNTLIEYCSGECQCPDAPFLTTRRCFGCKKMVCNNCEIYWMKCPNFSNNNCIYLSGNRYCYGCVRAWRTEGTVCPMCTKKPVFFLQ